MSNFNKWKVQLRCEIKLGENLSTVDAIAAKLVNQVNSEIAVI